MHHDFPLTVEAAIVRMFTRRDHEGAVFCAREQNRTEMVTISTDVVNGSEIAYSTVRAMEMMIVG
jgi:hypothetical protein